LVEPGPAAALGRAPSGRDALAQVVMNGRANKPTSSEGIPPLKALHKASSDELKSLVKKHLGETSPRFTTRSDEHGMIDRLDRKRPFKATHTYHPGVMDLTSPNVIEGKPIAKGEPVRIVNQGFDPANKLVHVADAHGNRQSVWKAALVRGGGRKNEATGAGGDLSYVYGHSVGTHVMHDGAEACRRAVEPQVHAEVGAAEANRWRPLGRGRPWDGRAAAGLTHELREWALPRVGSPLHIHFDPSKHPRGRSARFIDVLGKLERAEHGSTVTLPRGIHLRRDLRGLAVVRRRPAGAGVPASARGGR